LNFKINISVHRLIVGEDAVQPCREEHNRSSR